MKTGQDRAVPAIEWEVCLHNTCHSAKSLLLKIEKNKTKQKSPHEAMGQSVVTDTALQEELSPDHLGLLTRSKHAHE